MLRNNLKINGKNTLMKLRSSTPFFILFLLSILIQSCSKTNYDYLLRPFNEIKQFYIVTSTGDTTKCLIQGDSITVFWNADVAMPDKVSPRIVVDEKATVSPASGEAVSFTKNTTYTVTAENGDVKTYRLNPIVKKPLPSISNVSGNITWLSTTQLNIYGENFLVQADAANIGVYLQRVSDGFEFPLEVIKERTTNYSLIAKVPEFTESQGIGLHKLYMKIGDKPTKSVDIQVYAPDIYGTQITSSFVQEGQDIHAGDMLTINYAATDNQGGKVARFYSTNDVETVLLYISYEESVEIKQFTRTANSIQFKVPDEINKFVGKKVGQLRLFYKSAPPDQATFSSYRHTMYLTKPSNVVVK